MVLISEVIMVVTTLVTLCQSAPARRGAKTKRSDGRIIVHNQSEPYDHDDAANGGEWSIWPADTGLGASAGSTGNWTRTDQLTPGTSSASHSQRENGSNTQRHPMRHRQHEERHQDSTRRRHKQHPHNQEQQQQQQNHNSRGRYEHLCETVMKTVHLNTDSEEYNPPFYVEVRCRQPQQTHAYSTVQKCAFNLLHCVQTYSTMNFSRRKADGSDCWQPFTLDVPSGCECMWPIEEFGPLNRRDDL